MDIFFLFRHLCFDKNSFLIASFLQDPYDWYLFALLYSDVTFSTKNLKYDGFILFDFDISLFLVTYSHKYHLSSKLYPFCKMQPTNSLNSNWLSTMPQIFYTFQPILCLATFLLDILEQIHFVLVCNKTIIFMNVWHTINGLPHPWEPERVRNLSFPMRYYVVA